MSTDNMNAQVIGYIEKSGQALGAAEQLFGQVNAELTKIASLAPAVAAEVAREGLLQPNEVDTFAQKIASHEGSIQVIRKLASMLGKARRDVEKAAAASPGQAVPATGPASLTKVSCFVGQRTGLGEVDNAKLASEIALGLATAE